VTQLHDLFDFQEDDFPTSPAEIDLAAFARSKAQSVPDIGDANPISGVRPSIPTITNEVGALPNEPEDDAIFRRFGCAARVLQLQVSHESLARFHLEPRQTYVLGLLEGDGQKAICDVLDESVLPRFDTLCALEDLVTLEIVG
jgi:hypothetical protein